MIGNLNKPVICANGFKMSVQANANAYCEPRQDNAAKYSFVEVGYPSSEEPLLAQYAEDPENLTGTVYVSVPSAIVSLVIAKHGGMISGEVPPGVAQIKPITESDEFDSTAYEDLPPGF